MDEGCGFSASGYCFDDCIAGSSRYVAEYRFLVGTPVHQKGDSSSVSAAPQCWQTALLTETGTLQWGHVSSGTEV
jgi:hypothetical protein